jgi:hypothetical protein
MKRSESDGKRWVLGPVRSWWKPWTWLRRSGAARLTRTPEQLEMILGGVRPLRHTLGDDDVELVRRRGGGRVGGRVLHESRPPETGQSAVEVESDRAWKRLRGRRMSDLKVGVD